MQKIEKMRTYFNVYLQSQPIDASLAQTLWDNNWRELRLIPQNFVEPENMEKQYFGKDSNISRICVC